MNLFFIKLIFFFLIGISVYSQETTKFKVPKVVVEKTQKEFVGLTIQSLSYIQTMDQYLIDGEIQYSNSNKAIVVNLSITGQNGLVVSSTLRLKNLDFKIDEENKWIQKSTPLIPWDRMIRKLDRNDWQMGINYLSYTELSEERGFELYTNSTKKMKTTVYSFDEEGYLIKKEKLRY
jgi:hypothetical protein